MKDTAFRSLDNNVKFLVFDKPFNMFWCQGSPALAGVLIFMPNSNKIAHRRDSFGEKVRNYEKILHLQPCSTNTVLIERQFSNSPIRYEKKFIPCNHAVSGCGFFTTDQPGFFHRTG